MAGVARSTQGVEYADWSPTARTSRWCARSRTRSSASISDRPRAREHDAQNCVTKPHVSPDGTWWRSWPAPRRLLHRGGGRAGTSASCGRETSEQAGLVAARRRVWFGTGALPACRRRGRRSLGRVIACSRDSGRDRRRRAAASSWSQDEKVRHPQPGSGETEERGAELAGRLGGHGPLRGRRLVSSANDGAAAWAVASISAAPTSPPCTWVTGSRSVSPPTAPGLSRATWPPVPTGAGEPDLATAPIDVYGARWFADGRRPRQEHAPDARAPLRPRRVRRSAAAPSRQMTGIGVVSPDGKWVATIGHDSRFSTRRTAGAPAVSGARPPLAVQWSSDGAADHLRREGELPCRCSAWMSPPAARSVEEADAGGRRRSRMATRSRGYVYTTGS